MKKYNILDFVGKTYHNLTILGVGAPYIDSKGKRKPRAKCLCKCGITLNMLMHDVLSGGTKSCGCLYGRPPKTKLAATTRTKKKEYRSWRQMIYRCYSEKSGIQYERYGKRGISVCDRWLESFENFLIDMGEIPSSSHSIDRINNNGNYEPSNCRWATRQEQNKNRRTTIIVEINGETKCLKDWCLHYKLSYSCIRYRINTLNMDIHSALTKQKLK